MKVGCMPFTAPLALAIKEGRKTQTRRLLNPMPRLGEYGNGEIIRHDYFVWESKQGVCPITEKGMYRILRQAPHQPDDILWVREPGKVIAYEESPDCQFEWLRIQYGADGYEKEINTPWRMSEQWDSNGQKYPYGAPNWAWKKQGIPNGIFKEAARLFLKVKNVRVERLQDITNSDAAAEGVGPLDCPGLSVCGGPCEDCQEERDQFSILWNRLAMAGKCPGWGENPWVWVYEFERTERPADWPEN